MPDEATLKDVTATPNPAAAASTPEPEKQADAQPTVPQGNVDAAELGQLLMDSGWSKDNINDLLASPQALNAIRYQIENDPAEFIKSIERTNPKVGENLLEKASDLYINRYAPKDSPAKAGNGKSEVPNELMSEVSALREKIAGFETREEQRNRAAATAQIESRYKARVDDLFSTEGVKALGLTRTEQTAMKAMLNQELASDPAAVQRVSNGNFIDVPRRFQSILNDWSADKKAAITAEKTARERSSSSAANVVFDGPNPFALDNIPATTFDSWDATENALAAAFKKMAGA